MSVQTQIDRINGEVSDQTALLAQIQTALEGKAAGGGSGGGLQMVTGTFTPTNIDFMNNPISITGLGFQPKYVDIMLKGQVSLSLDTHSKTICLHWDESMGDNSIYVNVVFGITSVNGKKYIATATAWPLEKSLGVVVNDDGFTLKSCRDDYDLQLTKYSYVAIG